MAINFPSSPATNDTYTDPTSGNSWKYDGTKWIALPDTSVSGGDADTLDGFDGTYYLNYNNFTNTPTVYTDSSVDTHLNTSTAATGEILGWNGTDYDWVAGYSDSSVDTHLNTSTAATNEVLTWNGSDYTWAAGGGGLFDSYAIFQHKTAGDGGNASASTWNTRPLNTTVLGQTWASLSSNQVTLTAGEYLIEWSSCTYDSHLNHSRLRNITDGTTAGIGTSGRARAGDEDANASMGVAYVNIAASKAFEIQHWVATTRATNGLGVDTTSDEDNVFGHMKITKHA